MPASIDFESILSKCSTKVAYREMCKKATHGREFNPDELEQKFSGLRTDKGRFLCESDLDRIFEEGKTVYGYYWKPPTGVNWAHSEISLHESQCAKSGWKESIVHQLFSLLTRMEVVSVLLRCVYPDDFAVYSPPLMTILQVPPCPPMQHYLKYCEELQEWGRHFLGSKSVSTADRALWVFYQSAYAPSSPWWN